MKKFLCVLFAAMMPLLMLTACSEDKPADTQTTGLVHDSKVNDGKVNNVKTLTEGIYLLENDDKRSVQVQVRDSQKFVIHFCQNIDNPTPRKTESGTYSIEGDILRVKIEKTGCEYVFNIEGNSFFYDAKSSKPSDNFRLYSGIGDGARFFIDKEYERK